MQHIITIPMSPRDLSHELRVSLSGILGVSALLQQENLTPSQQEYIAILTTAGNRLLALTELLTAKKSSLLFSDNSVVC